MVTLTIRDNRTGETSTERVPAPCVKYRIAWWDWHGGRVTAIDLRA